MLLGTTTSNVILHMLISEKTTDIGPCIRQPSVCFINYPLREKTLSFVNLSKNFFKIYFLKDSFCRKVRFLSEHKFWLII